MPPPSLNTINNLIVSNIPKSYFKKNHEDYIINPKTNMPVSIEDWRKDENPTRAQLLAIETEDGHLLCMSKSYLPGEHTFEEAQKACAAFHPLESITFRAPSHKECIDIYDARFQGLDEAIKLTGGDYAKRGRYHWTKDRDTDPNNAYGAWYSSGNLGSLSIGNMYGSGLALPVAVIGKPELDEVAKKIAYDVCKDLKAGEKKDAIVYYAILAAIAGAKWMAGIIKENTK